MADVVMIDRNGQPPTVAEIEESLAVVRKCLVKPDLLLKMPPELAVQMPTILRQLQTLHTIATFKAP